MSFERFDTGTVAWEPADKLDEAAPPSGSVEHLHALIERMEQSRRPYSLSREGWHALLKAMRSFVDNWLDLALACGWTLPELFGSPRDFSRRRLDQRGLIWLLDGREVVAIDEHRVLLETPRGDRQSLYRRAPGSDALFPVASAPVVWDVVAWHD